MNQSASPTRVRVFESVSRRTYWIGTGGLTLVLIVLSWWVGLYYVTTPEEHGDQRVSSGDPLTEILYSPLGNAVVMLVLQFIAANILFWIGAWVVQRVRG